VSFKVRAVLKTRRALAPWLRFGTYHRGSSLFGGSQREGYAGVPRQARLAPSVANDAAAPETEARPPRQAAAAARTPRGGVHCVPAIAGETQQRVDTVTAIAPGCARESGRHVDS
jgi:hypothetical protein